MKSLLSCGFVVAGLLGKDHDMCAARVEMGPKAREITITASEGVTLNREYGVYIIVNGRDARLNDGLGREIPGPATDNTKKLISYTGVDLVISKRKVYINFAVCIEHGPCVPVKGRVERPRRT